MKENNDQLVAKLQRDVVLLTELLKMIGKRIEFLERENNRRKQEVHQVASHIKG